MPGRSLFSFLREALYRWREQGELCASLRAALRGDNAAITATMAKMIHLLLSEARRGAYDAMLFSKHFANEKCDWSLDFLKAGKQIDDRDIPPRLFESLRESFELLAELAGTARCEFDLAVETSATFVMSLATGKAEVAIVKTEPSPKALEEFLQALLRWHTEADSDASAGTAHPDLVHELRVTVRPL